MSLIPETNWIESSLTTGLKLVTTMR